MAGLIDAAGAKRIESAVAALEQRSATEVVVAVVPVSGEYTVFRAAAAALALVALVGVASWFWLEVPLLAGLGVVGAAYVGLFWLTGRGFVLRRIVPEGVRDEVTVARAQAVFTREGVYRTRERTGMLLFISEAEHRVVVLGDSGLEGVVGGEAFASYVDQIVQAIRAGTAADGIVAVLESVSAALAQTAPRRADDANELANAVVRG